MKLFHVVLIYKLIKQIGQKILAKSFLFYLLLPILSSDRTTCLGSNLKDSGNLFCEISQPALKSLVHRKGLKQNITMYNRVFHELHKISNTPVLVFLSDNETIQQ